MGAGCEFVPKVVFVGGIATFMDGRRWLKLEGLGDVEWVVVGLVCSEELEELVMGSSFGSK
jgi:hypothetical protein